MRVAIIGRGAAGLAIQNNLQDYQKNFFTIIDENKNRLPLLNKIPLLGGLIFRNEKYVEKVNIYANDRVVTYFKSKVIGGATAINGCVATLGDKKLWDTLYEKYYDVKAPDLQVPFGYNVSMYKSGKIEKKLKEIIGRKNEYNPSLYSNSDCHGEVFITKNRITRSNLTDIKSSVVVKSEMVEKIKYYQNKITLFMRSGEELIFDKLILSAGVIGTIKLLATCNDKYVGENLIKDHPNIRIKIKLKDKYKNFSLNYIEKNFLSKLFMLIEYLVMSQGMMQGSGGSYVIYKDFDNDGIVDTKLQILFFTENGRLGTNSDKYFFDNNPGISISINLYKSGSRGVYDSRSGKINFDYLGSEIERIQLNNAVKFIHDLVYKTELNEIADYIIDEEKFNEKYFKSIVSTGYHFISGHEKNTGWNLNKNLSIKGMSRIYCVDATSFPIYTASNISLPISLLAQHWIKTRNEFNF